MGIAGGSQLIVTVVTKDRTEEVLNAIEREGVAKSTVLLGRRIGDDNLTFLELKIELSGRSSIPWHLIRKWIGSIRPLWKPGS